MSLLKKMLSLSLISSLALFAKAEEIPSSIGKIAPTAETVTPLQPDATLPDVTLQTEEGKETTLKDALGDQPTIIVFYRGHWCPFCMMHLQGLQQAYGDITALGYKLIAIAPNTPEKLAETDEKLKMDYTLLSDTKMDAAKAFGIAFQVDDDTIEKYKGYKIDLVEASGETHNALPVPAIFIVDKAGLIRFTHADADYTKRLDNETLLKEAKAAIE